MILSAIAASLLGARGAAEPPSIDLFLVSGGSALGANWLEQAAATPVEAVLRSKLAAFDAERKPYLVLGFGEFSSFTPKGQWLPVSYFERRYEDYDSATESITVGKRTQTRVVARTSSTVTSSGGVNVRPWEEKSPGYMAQSRVHLSTDPKKRAFFVMQDVNSYRSVSERGTAQDRQTLDRTLLLSPDSINDTREALRRSKVDFTGVCICAWGIPKADAPGMIAFPSPQVVSHYRLALSNGAWSATLVEYLRPPRS